MVRTCLQKSPFTSMINPPIFRLGSSARHRRSWSTYGYMHADVLPVPTAPRIAMPVYSPRSGITSQSGECARPGVFRECASPRTTDGAGRRPGTGYSGSARDLTLGACRYVTIANDDNTTDAAKNDVENHIVA